MRFRIAVLMMAVAATAAWSEPSLVLLDRADLPIARDRVTVLRELTDQVFVAADTLQLAAAGLFFKVLDADYEAGRYLLVGPRQAGREGRVILWRDPRRVLIRTYRVQEEWTGRYEALEKGPVVERESRPPSGLDDATLDPWLTSLVARVNADSLFGYVVSLASYNRYARWTSNDAAAAWIRDKFLSLGLDSVYYHQFTTQATGWSRLVNNIVAVLPGTTSPDSIVVIGGHMDATSNNPSVGAPGANDNASGTAAVLECARLLVNEQFRHTLMFVGFNGEEQGLDGSRALATLMAQQGRRVVGMLNLDMVGVYAPGVVDAAVEKFSQGTNSEWLGYALRDNFHQFTPLVASVMGGEGWGSDHVSFHDAGYPAVLTIMYDYEADTCYHNLCDLPVNINHDYLREMSAANIVTAAELAGPLSTASISGTVTLQGTGDASQVIVTVMGGTEPADTTAADGLYRVSSLVGGVYSLVFERFGWTTDTLHDIVVTAGQELPDQNIMLLIGAAGSISGSVSISGGTGVLTDAIVDIGPVLTNVNGDGSFHLVPVYAGSYAVTAALDEYALASQAVTITAGQQIAGLSLTLYPVWDLEASGYGLDNHGTNWGWGTDATAGAHSGTHVWGTVLGGNYGNCGDYRLEMPPVCLVHLDSVRLNLWHWYDIEPNGVEPYDGANVAVAPFGTDYWNVVLPDGGYPAREGYTCNPYQNQPAYAGNSSGWRQASFNLSAFVGQTVRIEFRLGTDVGTTRRGWYLDDLALLAWHSVATNPPAAVSDLTINPDGDNIVLRWSASAGAAAYRVYRGNSFDESLDLMTLLDTVTQTTFVDTGASSLDTAFYVVVAVN
jgi:hypothetical protein